ncbi:MAG TPA: type II secretion system F family protein [Coriobacteriia bacterium]|jgi:type IV pilus assembly protein PilC
MGTFAYTVRDKAGKIVKGTLEGDNRDNVSAKLRQTGYIILDVSEKNVGLQAPIKLGGGSGRVKAKDLTVFSRQFSTMINAGLSLTKCLGILAGQTESPNLKAAITQVARDVESGQSLSDSMGKHAKTFPNIFINMVRAGETGGVLDEVLLRVADHFESEAALKAKIKSAMTYPIAMFVLVMAVAAGMLIFVMPVFQQMFQSMGGKLPGLTQALIDLSNFLRGVGGIVVAAVSVGLGFAFRAWKETPAGRLQWDTIRLKLPVVGPLSRKMALARFTRTFGTLVSAGVPILSALDIVGDTAGNEVVAQAVKKIRAAIKEGETIAKPLSEAPVFPSMLVQMIAVGEETGALDSMLNKVADFYDEEVSSSVDALTSMIEPLMMAFLAGVVGTMVVAMYLPMFNVIGLVK